jgi:energy-coupling factor transporter ATP-binding protein EcfA2
MYISKIRLVEIRCFKDLTIEFDNPESGALFLGDNGDGKSTLLRSIAMGLCDQSSAAALFRELPGEYLRRDSSRRVTKKEDWKGAIEIDLYAGGGVTYRIVTTINSWVNEFERITQDRYIIKGNRKPRPVSTDDFPWEKIFVSGYGSGLRTQGTSDFQHYLAVDAVYPIFKYDAPLQNPELVIRRLVDEAESKSRSYSALRKRAKMVLQDC